MKKHALFVVTAILIAAAIAVWCCWPRLHPPVKRVAARGLSPWAEEAVAKTVLSVETFYLQTDPRWAHEKIGGSGEELHAVGCTNCCLCMALA